MMQMDKTVLAGAGGLLAGFLLSFAIGSSGRAGLEAQLRERGDVLTSVSALETKLAELDGKLDASAAALDAKLDASAEAIGTRLEASTTALTEHVTAATSAPGEGLQALTERVESLGSDIATRLESVAPSVRSALTGEFETVRGGLAALATRGETAVGEALDAVAGREETAAAGPVGDPSLATGEGAEVAVASTAMLADGAVRVFLSSTDAEAGTAQVAVNGFRREAIALGGSLTAGDCTVVMTGLAAGSAVFDATCGEAAAASASDSEATAPVEAEEAAVAAAPAGAGRTLTVGQTAIFADGAVRVFLSSVDAEGGSARVAVNAAKPAAIEVGAPQAMGPCTVTLTAVAPGNATFDGSCGDAAAATTEAPAAAAAATSEAPAGSGAGTEISIGQTAIFADGKLRVFLSAFDEAAGTARVAINGLSVTSLTMSEEVTAGDCRVTLTGGSGRSATIDGSC